MRRKVYTAAQEFIKKARIRKVTGVLRRKFQSEPTVRCMCFSGVLCELYRRETGKGFWRRIGTSGLFSFTVPEKYSTLPAYERAFNAEDIVLRWAGVGREELTRGVHLNDDSSMSLKAIFLKLKPRGVKA